MNLKLVLAAALFVSTGTFVAQAQTKTAVSKATTSSAAKAFEQKINAYKAESDQDKATLKFRAMNTDMSAGMASAKSELAAATTDAQKEAANAKLNARMSAMNESMKLYTTSPTNKTAIAEALTKFAKTL